MLTEALPITWMDALAMVLLVMMVGAGLLGLWRRWTVTPWTQRERTDRRQAA